MNCTAVFYLLRMYSSIALNPASYIAATAGVYSHFLLVRLRRSLPVKLRATWSWNPPRTRTMQGVTTQVSAPKSSINWTTALKKNTDTRSTVPPMLRIIVNLRHTARAFVRFLNTAEKASPIADITCPKYLKEITISRGSTYAMNALEVTDLSSSADRRRIFCYAPFFHSAVHQ